MKIRTQDLSGPALDWAVATALGRTVVRDPMGFQRDAPNSREAGYWIWEESSSGQVSGPSQPTYQLIGRDFAPSSDWAIAGPLIEREGISLTSEARDGSLWKAQLAYTRQVLFLRPARLIQTYCLSRGPTPLIAALRCHVTSKLGDYVDVPDALVSA